MWPFIRNLVLTSASLILSLTANSANTKVIDEAERVQSSASFAEFIKQHGTNETQSLLDNSRNIGAKLAQWVNWPNWGNWNNWNNWGNFGRLPQWGNGWNNFLN
jgi:hypothetical protein